MEMTNETRELLIACREAGYEIVAIFCEDKRVPESKGFSGSSYPYVDGSRRLVCCHPPQRDKVVGQVPEWPSIWRIIKEQGLNYSGAGYGDCFPVGGSQLHLLTTGCYETKDIESPVAV